MTISSHSASVKATIDFRSRVSSLAGMAAEATPGLAGLSISFLSPLRPGKEQPPDLHERRPCLLACWYAAPATVARTVPRVLSLAGQERQEGARRCC